MEVEVEMEEEWSTSGSAIETSSVERRRGRRLGVVGRAQSSISGVVVAVALLASSAHLLVLLLLEIVLTARLHDSTLLSHLTTLARTSDVQQRAAPHLVAHQTLRC